MAKTCPSCGFQSPDDKALFCNKCGRPFPVDQPKKRVIVTRAENHAPRVSVDPYDEELKIPGKKPLYEKAGMAGFLTLDILITRDYLSMIYILGAVGIVLVSLLGIAGGFSKPGAAPANASFINTTAIGTDPAGSPLSWIGFLLIGSLIWRMFCELFEIGFRLEDAFSPDGDAPLPRDENPAYSSAPVRAIPEDKPIQYAECPRCAKTVPVDQLRECEHCGVQGCSNCIRPMGLLKKTLTCKDCFEKK